MFMANSANCSDRDRLEKALCLAEPRPSRSHWTRIQRVLASLSQGFYEALMRDRTEPRVWHTTRRGERRWHVYDPLTHQSFSSSSEQEIRAWLESRYHSGRGNGIGYL
jgi:hypothetical protein